MGELVTWIDPDGAETALRVKYAVRGRFAPPARFEEEGAPEQSGMRLRAVHHGVREFVLPIHIAAASDAGLRSTLRTLMYALDPTRGDGRIRTISPLSDQREITCRVSGGLELDEVLGTTSTPIDQLATVVFRAHDPYWYSTTDDASVYPFTGTAETFFPILPINLSASETFADDTVTNLGDLDAWPVWSITGPLQTITLRHIDTSEVLTATLPLAAADVLTIDTRPGVKTVVEQDGTNRFPSLATTSVMWSLRRGPNVIRIEMGGAGIGSSVQLAYRTRYLSP